MVSRFHLKMLAIITMFVDHFAAVFHEFFDQSVDGYGLYLSLRNIGRIAFPIFLYLFVVGYYQTANRSKNLLLLLISAIVSEIPFQLAFKESSHHNIFWTFLIIGISLSAWDYLKKIPGFSFVSWLLLFIISGFVADYLGVDYGSIATGMAFLIALFPNSQLLAGITVFVGGIVQNNFWLAFASFSCVFIWLVNLNKKCWRLKYFFYIFYPLHLIVLILFREFL